MRTHIATDFLLTASTAAYATCITTHKFDYVILGGGTAGLAVANRLSVDPSISVAVVEAGDSVYDDPRVQNVSTFGLAQNTELDWVYSAEPDEGGRVLNYSAGKALGGTSVLNGMTYVRAEDVQIDTWAAIGNEGWTWSSLLPFYKKSEFFFKPDAVRQAKGASYDEDAHGYIGNVGVGWSSYLTGQNISNILCATNEALGLPCNSDPNSGRVRGYSTWPQTLDANTDIRCDSARAYLWGKASKRPNLHVFTRTQATELVWDDSSSSDSSQSLLRASGVQVRTSFNTTSTISLNTNPQSEVIISLGSLRSPLLLEHSGIGNPSILASQSIPLRRALPSVGMHMQDQTNNAFVYASTVNWTGYPTFVTYATTSDILGPATPSFAASVDSSIPSFAATIAQQSGNATSTGVQERLLRVQSNLLFNTSTPAAEILWAPSGANLIGVFWPLLPFARGSVHVSSGEPLSRPQITQRLWQFNYDLSFAIQTAKAVRRAFAKPPLSEYVGAETSPGFELVPEDAGDDIWSAWLRGGYSSNNHPIGVCAMLPEELGGVVDEEGRIYGTGNVRVVDASVIPWQVSGHLSATVYAIAEKISEGILAGRM